MSMCKLSIITPAYNAEKYIKETIVSVQSQTFKDWELIICDDCSTDATYEIAFNFAKVDERIKVIRNKINSGVAQTRNNALDVANGDYIAFLDSDDLWLPEKIQKQITFMENNNYVFTYTAYQKFESKTGILGKTIKAKPMMTVDMIYKDTSIGCLTVVVNRKIVGNFHMPLIGHTEDNCTWQEILNRGYIAYGLNEVLALYRERKESLTNSKISAAKLQWETYRKYYKFSVFRSAYYFVCYVINALKKHY